MIWPLLLMPVATVAKRVKGSVRACVDTAAVEIAVEFEKTGVRVSCTGPPRAPAADHMERKILHPRCHPGHDDLALSVLLASVAGGGGRKGEAAAKAEFAFIIFALGLCR